MPILRKGQRCSPGEERVNIRYYAAPNTAPSGGFCPAFRNGTTEHGSIYCTGMDKDRALRVARVAAFRAGKRYSGDWCVIIGKGTRHTPRYRR